MDTFYPVKMALRWLNPRTYCNHLQARWEENAIDFLCKQLKKKPFPVACASLCIEGYFVQKFAWPEHQLWPHKKDHWLHDDRGNRALAGERQGPTQGLYADLHPSCTELWYRLPFYIRLRYFKTCSHKYFIAEGTWLLERLQTYRLAHSHTTQSWQAHSPDQPFCLCTEGPGTWDMMILPAW